VWYTSEGFKIVSWLPPLIGDNFVQLRYNSFTRVLVEIIKVSSTCLGKLPPPVFSRHLLSLYGLLYLFGCMRTPLLNLDFTGQHCLQIGAVELWVFDCIP